MPPNSSTCGSNTMPDTRVHPVDYSSDLEKTTLVVYTDLSAHALGSAGRRAPGIAWVTTDSASAAPIGQ